MHKKQNLDKNVMQSNVKYLKFYYIYHKLYSNKVDFHHILHKAAKFCNFWQLS